MKIELLKEQDIPELQKMIVRVMKKSFAGFYPPAWIEDAISHQTIERLKQKRQTLHFYVLKKYGKICACGAIGGDYYGNKNEANLFSIYVDPDCQGKGYGRAIIEAIEKDEFFTRASRIECPSSLNAVPFYCHMGYTHKNGQLICQYGEVYLEKFNPPPANKV